MRNSMIISDWVPETRAKNRNNNAVYYSSKVKALASFVISFRGNTKPGRKAFVAFVLTMHSCSLEI